MASPPREGKDEVKELTSHIIRSATETDFDSMLRLNLESEHFLSPLSLPQLRSLHAQAWYCRVISVDARVQGFLLALEQGADYHSVNYQWFAARYSEYLYIDRVVVDSEARGQHLGATLYEDLFALARAAASQRITCEFDCDPPNEASRRFHERFGFREIGRQQVGQGKKTVSLQEVLLSPEVGQSGSTGATEEISVAGPATQVLEPEQCVDCEDRVHGGDFGRQWHLCQFCGEAVCESCEVTHFCEKQRSMNPNKLR